MNIPKAIKILEQQVTLTSPNLEPDLIKADLLGIQALIREQNNRINPGAYTGHLLPGETKD